MMTTASLVCCALLIGAPAAAQPTAPQTARCTETDVPVSVPGLHAIVHGQLCEPPNDNPKTVQLLVHGGTYNRVYWDFPYQPDRYSYQRDMAKHGYATFAIDRLGTGGSTQPPSTALLHTTEASSIHQVVSHLRAGTVNGQRFNRVILVSHSVGTGVTTLEAATYHDVDGVILTGANHLISLPAIGTGAATDLHPTALDPQLRKTHDTDPGYVTTKPGTRGQLFYATGDADPAVIATDEATKDQLSLPGMGPIALFGIILPATRRINVPVLLMIGEKDHLFCGPLAGNCSNAETLRQQEAPYFDPAAHLSTYVLPGAGHSLALHRNADKYREATRRWLKTTFDA